MRDSWIVFACSEYNLGADGTKNLGVDNVDTAEELAGDTGSNDSGLSGTSTKPLPRQIRNSAPNRLKTVG